MKFYKYNGSQTSSWIWYNGKLYRELKEEEGN